MSNHGRQSHSELIPLSVTSSLVLLWTSPDIYTSRQAQQCMSMLDPEAGRLLYKRCNTVWPHYDQVIINRKYGILHLMEECMRENRGLNQMVVLGAGLAPLSVEAAVRYPGLHVFDIDVDHMPLKAELLKLLQDRCASTVQCLTADIRDAESVRQQLVAAHWRPEKPTLVIVEGISYYLLPEELLGAINIFRNTRRDSRIVLEYLVPFERVTGQRRNIPKQVFQLIADTCGLPFITKLEPGDIASWKECAMLRRLTMRDIEKMRTGKNMFFPREDSGWIEVCCLAT